MKIVMLTNHIVPDKLGGLGRYVGELADDLQNRGHQVIVLTKRFRRELPAREVLSSGVEVRRYETTSRRNPFFAVAYPFSVLRNVRRLLREVVDAQTVLHAHYAFPALAIGRRRPFIYTFHAPVHKEIISERGDSYWLPAPLARIAVSAVRLVEQVVLRRAKRVITLSAFMRAEAESISRPVVGKTTVMPGGLNTDRFSFLESGNRAQSSLFTARRLVPRTGVVELVKAMVIVRSAVPDAILQIAGSGALEEDLRQLIERLGLRGSVELLGRISELDLIHHYQTSAVSVTPTRELEGFGLSTAEAMACGSIPLVTPVGANPEVVAGLGDGLCLADGSTPDDIARAIIRLLGSLDSIDRSRVRARAESWSWDAVGRRMETLYLQASGS